jgi:hypothetical protein
VIARVWEGRVPAEKADAYLALMEEIALPEYRATAGNLGAWRLHRREEGFVVVQMLTFWEDMDAVKRFAGDDPAKAHYYDFDPDYLLEMAPEVIHFEVAGDYSSGSGSAKT